MWVTLRDRVQGLFLFGEGGPGCLVDDLTLGGEVVGSLGMVVWEGDRDQSVGAKKNHLKGLRIGPEHI